MCTYLSLDLELL